MYCNLRPPEPRQSLLWRHPKLEVAEPIHCRIIAFLLLIHYFTLWPWPLTFDIEHMQRFACDVMKSVPNLNAVELFAAELLRFQCLTLWPWTLQYGTCCVRLWDNFHQVWLSTIYPCLTYSVFWCTLWPWPADTESSWYITRHVIKVYTKFEWRTDGRFSRDWHWQQQNRRPSTYVERLVYM